MDTEFISEISAQCHLGFSRNGWLRFVESAGLKLHTLPGGARVVNREALNRAVETMVSGGRAENHHD